MLRHFYVAMLAGIIIGTYSSIFNATPLVIVWENIANRGKGSTKKTEDKPMVEKPMVASALSEGQSDTDEDVSATSQPSSTSGRVKRKSTGRKKRF